MPKLRTLLKRANPPDRVRRRAWPEGQFLRMIATVGSNLHPQRKRSFNVSAWLMRRAGDENIVIARTVIGPNQDKETDWEPYDPVSTTDMPGV